MSLLQLSDVSFRAEHDGGLRGISLMVESAGIVAIRANREEGKSTLLQLAAGMLRPEAGTVAFDGRDPSRARGRKGGLALAHRRWSDELGEALIEHVAAPLTRQLSERRALTAADKILQRVGLGDRGREQPHDLRTVEQRRASIARALVTEPRLLIIDEPTTGLPVDDRDAILELLHAQVRRGVAVLMTVDSAAGLAGTRPLTLHQGRLRGEHEPRAAEVLPLLRRAT